MTYDSSPTKGAKMTTLEPVGAPHGRSIDRLGGFVLDELRHCKLNFEHEIDGRVKHTLVVATSPTFNASLRLSGSGKKVQFGKN